MNKTEKVPSVLKWIAPKTIIELARYTSWKKVKLALCYFYPETSARAFSGYHKVFNLVQDMKKIRTDKEEVVEIYIGENPLSGEADDTYYSVATNKLSLMFRPWKEVCSLQVDNDTLAHYKVEEIVSLFLWELTFSGYSEEKTMKRRKELCDIRTEVEGDTYKKSKFKLQ